MKCCIYATIYFMLLNRFIHICTSFIYICVCLCIIFIDLFLNKIENNMSLTDTMRSGKVAIMLKLRQTIKLSNGDMHK